MVPRRRILLLACVLTLVALTGAAAPRAEAKTCADYANQAAAQTAHDTRDGDGDGIFCEALPCPCLKPGGAAPAPQPTAPAVAPPKLVLGVSQALHPVAKRSGCRVRGALPD